MLELRPSEYRARWDERDEQARSVVLLDVREDWELAIAKIPQAQHIPMMQIPARLAELDRDAVIVVMCHHGGRSARVAQFLAAQGFDPVYNLAGGIDAWSQELDPSLPTY